MSRERPESLVDVLLRGLGMVVRRWPLRQMESPRSLALASCSLSHSRVTYRARRQCRRCPLVCSKAELTLV